MAGFRYFSTLELQIKLLQEDISIDFGVFIA